MVRFVVYYLHKEEIDQGNVFLISSPFLFLATSKEKHIPASLPTDRTAGGIDTSSSVESKQSTGSTSYHSLHRSASKARPSAEIGGSRDIVPFVRFPNQKDGDVKQRSLVVSETARHNNKHRTEGNLVDHL